MRAATTPSRRLLIVALILSAVTSLGLAASSAVFTETARSSSDISTAALLPPAGVTATDVRESTVLSWTPSASPFATGYTVSRATKPGGPFTPVATLTGRDTSTWTDPRLLTVPAWYRVTTTAHNWTTAAPDLLTSPPVTAYASAVRASSPVYWWRLDDEQDATTYLDSSGNDWHAIPYGGTPTSGGIRTMQQPSALASGEGSSMSTGAPDGGAVTVPTGTPVPANTFAFEAWVKTAVTHEIDPQATTGIYGNTGQNFAWYPNIGYVGVSVGTNGISVYEHNGGYMPALAVWSGAVGTGWNHIVVNYSGKRATIYLNGVAVRSGATSPQATMKAPVTFGSGGSAYGNFNGSLDEGAVYNRTLTLAEIQNHYNAGRRAPQDLTATTTSEAVSLSWTAPGGPITGYQIYRGTTTTNLIPLAQSPTATYADTSAAPGVSYYYAVAAITRSGEGTRSIPPVTGRLNTPYLDAVTASAPMYWWRLNDTSGTTAVDFGSAKANATWTGSPDLGQPSPLASGEGGSVTLTGTQADNDIGGIPATSTLPTNTFTLEMWVRPTATHEIDPQQNFDVHGVSGQRYIWSPDPIAGVPGAGVSVGTNGISVYEHTGSYMPALLVWQGTLSGWNHVVVVYNNRTPSLYVNGTLVKTGLTSPRATVHAPYQFGGHYYGWHQGGLAEAAIYNKALAATEIAAHYNAGRQP